MYVFALDVFGFNNLGYSENWRRNSRFVKLDGYNGQLTTTFK